MCYTTAGNNDPNNRFQGTLHKVSGPLNRDVGHKNMNIKFATAILLQCLLLTGCLSRKQAIGYDPIMRRETVVQIAYDAALADGNKMADFILHGVSYNYITRMWSVTYDLRADVAPPDSAVFIWVYDLTGKAEKILDL